MSGLRWKYIPYQSIWFQLHSNVFHQVQQLHLRNDFDDIFFFYWWTFLVLGVLLSWKSSATKNNLSISKAKCQSNLCNLMKKTSNFSLENWVICGGVWWSSANWSFPLIHNCALISPIRVYWISLSPRTRVRLSPRGPGHSGCNFISTKPILFARLRAQEKRDIVWTWSKAFHVKLISP